MPATALQSRMRGVPSLSSSPRSHNSLTTSQKRIQRLRVDRVTCAAGSNQSGKPKQKISGYTPAAYITFSEDEQQRCHHMVAIEVDAPASVCFELWNDWNRLVDYLDLISQIGLDPAQPDMALFQCFYRYAQLPVMEIVFLAKRTHVEVNKRIKFETVWGLPAKGEVSFTEEGGKTCVIFLLEHQLPTLLVDLQVGVFGVESSCRTIFMENMTEFKKLAEAVARDPSKAPARQQPEELEVVDDEVESSRSSDGAGPVQEAVAEEAPAGTTSGASGPVLSSSEEPGSTKRPANAAQGAAKGAKQSKAKTSQGKAKAAGAV
eukprot:CAMPEP_0202919418 /NCGR_PEP_ID=MMETSP1392-20130828/75775_1 /ASSEMBLY_ACC=CAM_ASM_000868 /TAXON_ID=225041 /ORGANISM="Chlamydomonas chlamydogama, Strain SAG 11-48b" /LENGTH=318 /DNA_ID=CAMNT_0049612769 /DNA_START=156 /DNA_END=1112 /DNA_ORIENTATION=-